MLPRKYKLTKKQEIEDLAKTGRRMQSVFFNVKYKENKLNSERWLLVVSSRVHKQAVKRNKIRRRVREIIRVELLGKMKSLDIMIVAKDKVMEAGFIDLKEDLLNVLKNIHQQN